jgi:hypothetical protein
MLYGRPAAAQGIDFLVELFLAQPVLDGKMKSPSPASTRLPMRP